MKFTYKTITFLTLFLLFSCEVFAGTYYQIPSYVQSNSVLDPYGDGTQVSASLTGVTAGNLLVALCFWNNNTYTGSVSDGTNTWIPIDSPQAGYTGGDFETFRAQTFYAKNVSAGNPTITCTISGTVQNRSITVHEITGADTNSPLDQHDSSANSPELISTTPTITTTQAAEHLFSGCLAWNNVFNTYPWNNREDESGYLKGTIDRPVANIGTYGPYIKRSTTGDTICFTDSFKGASHSGTIYTPPAYVQGASSQLGDGPSYYVDFSGNVTAGNVIALAIGWYGTSITLNSVTDNCNTGGTSNTYTLVDNPTSNADFRAAMAYAVVGNTGSCRVTATFSESIGGQNPSIIVHEISGVDTNSPVDQHYLESYASDTNTDGVTSTFVNTTMNGEYIFGFSFYGSFANCPTFTAGTGFTPRQGLAVKSCMKSEDRNLQNMYGPVAATFTSDFSEYDFLTGIMTFKPANAESESVGARTIRLSGHTRLRGGIRLK